MAVAEDLHAPVCPACIATPAPQAVAPAGTPDIILSVPAVHCAGCISTVERALEAVPGVKSARVNLTLKRANVEIGTADVSPDTLIAALQAVGYKALELDPAVLDATLADTAGRDLLMRLAVAGFAMMNVMLLSVAVWAGAEATTRDFMHWISAAIALPTIAFSAQPFFRNAWTALRVGALNMDVPISLAILLASAMSLYETMNSGAEAYFDAALSLTFFLLAGRYLDHRTRLAARSAARELAALEIPRALLVDGDITRTVDVAALSPGDVISVLPGTRLPTDGIIADGRSELDRSHLTGESIPQAAAPGDEVHAGAVNLTGPLLVRVTAAGAETSLRRMTDLVAIAETARNRYTSLADRAARIYAPGVHLLALAGFIGWLWVTGDLRYSLTLAISVLIITCPCALGLAVPAVTTAASGSLFRRGVLLKNATALERLAEVDTVVFDKTGTLTSGQPELDTHDLPDTDDIALAVALARHSTHPLAAALVQTLGADATPVDLDDVREEPGNGVSATWHGHTVRLGRADWVGVEPGTRTATWLRVGDDAAVGFFFNETLRDGAADAIAPLRARGIGVHMLTGDNEPQARAIAAELGIGNVLAQAMPDDKLAYINDLTAKGRKVLMVGDGLNDTGALTAAHVSAAPASALDAARVASDVVLLGDGIDSLTGVFDVARKARRLILQNFAVAAAYNAVAIPMALLGFATPLMAAVAMSASSITVSLNAMRVR